MAIAELNISTEIIGEDIHFLQSHYKINSDAEWQLRLIDDNYQLTHTTEKLSYQIDFRTGKYAHRHHNKGKEPLLNAIKIKGKLPNAVLDATPGALKDGFLMASRGIAVTAIERSPIMYILLQQAIKLANINITLHYGDSVQLLAHYPTDLIYIDPMYPPRKKTAQVKKDMQIIKQLVGFDLDADKLLNAAIHTNTRVVVKRPTYADNLAEFKPSFISKTGNTRFDIYLPT